METVAALAALAKDPSDVVRQSVVAAMGSLGRPARAPVAPSAALADGAGCRAERSGSLCGEKSDRPPLRPPTDQTGRGDARRPPWAIPTSAVRAQAALALGRIGPDAATVRTPTDPSVSGSRRNGALPRGPGPWRNRWATMGPRWPHWWICCATPSATVKVSAAQALGALRKAAAPSVPALVPLLQDRDESVRTAAAVAIAQVGPLDHAATANLSLGLGSRDNVVRAQTAEALGTIGAAAEEAAPALVQATTDGNDRVRAKAVEALGKIGEPAAAIAVPGLVRASWIETTGSAPWPLKPWARWGIRPTARSRPWSVL